MIVLKSIANGYNKVLGATSRIAAALIIALFVLICIQVFARLLPVPPVLWTTDFAIYCLVFLGFLGMAHLLRRGAHVAIDVLVDALPPVAGNIISIIVCLIGVATTVFVGYIALDVTINQFVRGVFVNAALFNMPKWILLAIIPFGLWMSCIEFIVLIFQHFKKLLFPEAAAKENN